MSHLGDLTTRLLTKVAPALADIDAQYLPLNTSADISWVVKADACSNEGYAGLPLMLSTAVRSAWPKAPPSKSLTRTWLESTEVRSYRSEGAAHLEPVDVVLSAVVGAIYPASRSPDDAEQDGAVSGQCQHSLPG
jgi:hypothetical protein